MNIDLAYVFGSPSVTPFLKEESGTHKGLFRKELIYVGRFRKGDAFKLDVDEPMLQHWHSTFLKMSQNGVDVPVPIEHTTDPEKRRGTMVATEVAKNTKGKTALFGYFKFRDAEAEKLAQTTNVSIYVPPHAPDGNGNTYYRPIRHVALTDYPVIPGLSGFQAIAASFESEGDIAMSLMSLAEKFGIPIADKSEPELEAAILMNVQTLKTENDNLKAEVEKLKNGDATPEGEVTPPEGGTPPVPSPAPIAAGFIDMGRENRAMKIDQLVTARKITPAVANGLKKQFCSDVAISLSLQAGTKDDGFSATVMALSLNEPVISSGERTSAQALRDPAKNPLVADAERRSAARK